VIAWELAVASHIASSSKPTNIKLDFQSYSADALSRKLGRRARKMLALCKRKVSHIDCQFALGALAWLLLAQSPTACLDAGEVIAGFILDLSSVDGLSIFAFCGIAALLLMEDYYARIGCLASSRIGCLAM
jgi:hypothetical protein